MSRPRRGHPGVVPGERLRGIEVTLSEEQIAFARQLGGGVVSRGVRAALDALIDGAGDPQKGPQKRP